MCWVNFLFRQNFLVSSVFEFSLLGRCQIVETWKDNRAVFEVALVEYQGKIRRSLVSLPLGF